MSFAEIFLRIGSGIGGWIICFAHALVIAVLGRADCDPSSDDLWAGTLFFALLGLGGSVTLSLGLRWRQSLKWVALVNVPLAAYALAVVLPAIVSTSLGGESLCVIAGSVSQGLDLAAHPATTLQRIWPIVQVVALTAGSLQALRYWLPVQPTAPQR